MKTLMKLAVLSTAILTGTANAGSLVDNSNSASSNATTSSSSGAANMGVNAVVKSYGSEIPDSTTNWVFQNPATVTPASNFGWSPSNCGASDSKTFGVVIGSYGESTAKPMFDCNTREDSTMAWKMGLRSVAVLRMFCFGSDANRMAYEASGHQCPVSGTAKGIEGAPTLPKILAVAPQVKRGHINPDGTITWQK